MGFLLLIAFIAVPVIEIAVFIEVGGWIGLWPTIGVVILTAIIGTGLLRQQGISILFRIQENLEANKLPVRELFDGVCLVIAGAFLLTPGFVTDSLGFALFVPANPPGQRRLDRAKDWHACGRAVPSRTRWTANRSPSRTWQRPNPPRWCRHY